MGPRKERRSGKKKGRSKFTPTGPAAPDHAWASFWNQDAETAFQSLKQMATNAVELQVPDFEGSRLGTNPFHIWVDACAYGIGGGLFQGPMTETPAHDTKHYQVLGLPT